MKKRLVTWLLTVTMAAGSLMPAETTWAATNTEYEYEEAGDIIESGDITEVDSYDLTEISEEPVTVTITFMDHGIPYDPLAKADPDLSLTADERQIGGLGIFLTKKTMDDVKYEYEDGKNILTLKKNL